MKFQKGNTRWNVENLYAVRQEAENFVEDKLFLQILINIHKQVKVFLHFGWFVMP
jgi:hypothetical protein